MNGSDAGLIILYFDECHTLSDASPTGYEALCLALSYLSGVPSIFALTLSIHSNLPLHAPFEYDASSARVSGPAFNSVPALYAELSFDCHQDFNTEPGTLTVENTQTVAFISRFGRPLYV